MKVTPLSKALGAEITGLDLRQPLDDATAQVIRDAFDQHIFVVFRAQKLSEEDQIRAAGYFGKVHIRRRPVTTRDPGGQFDTPFMLVTNIVENGKSIGVFGDGEMWFHHDTSYYPEPHRATLLYSMKLPSWGGNTCFSNMYKAYENIPRPLRDKLEGKKVLQVHDYKRRERLDLDKIDLNSVRHHEQPIFITHPATGRKALYISRLMSARIVGLSRDESAAVLEQLFEISEDPAIVYEHEWKLGDLVIWDNWCSIHARKDFPRDQPRLMRRLTIEGQAMRF
ncbi:MAG: TauD/TfdA family dioxygenase [Xanthobacteraceae bacterium]|nr:TauD/TfdA family dioxygenase [Xanthobacteraceae bacterium]